MNSDAVAGADARDPYRDTARQVCTSKQLRILELREQHGFSLRTIALAVDTSPLTVRDHLDAMHRRIGRALRATAPS